MYGAIAPETQWGWSEVFANKTNHLLELLLWQNAYDAKKKAEWKAKRPKAFVPDFMKKPEPPSPINKGSEAHITDEIRNILAQPRG